MMRSSWCNDHKSDCKSLRTLLCQTLQSSMSEYFWSEEVNTLQKKWMDYSAQWWLIVGDVISSFWSFTCSWLTQLSFQAEPSQLTLAHVAPANMERWELWITLQTTNRAGLTFSDITFGCLLRDIIRPGFETNYPAGFNTGWKTCI